MENVVPKKWGKTAGLEKPDLAPKPVGNGLKVREVKAKTPAGHRSRLKARHGEYRCSSSVSKANLGSSCLV